MNTIDTPTLWRIFTHIGRSWGTDTYCTLTEAQFAQALAARVAHDPSYSAHYQAAATAYSALLEQHGEPATALRALLSENQLPAPRLPAVANYVLLEFMRWNVAFGGFRAFGFTNYIGWTGADSFLSTPPPYRALPPSAARTDDQHS